MKNKAKIIEKNGEKYYRWWQLFDKLPNGWYIYNTCGSPVSGYAFCISGSVLKGGKRALVRTKNK